MAIDLYAPHALYRFFGAGGTLLYIGITNDLGRRLGRHDDEKPWWMGVNMVTVEHFPDRPSVLEAERRAIKAEKPLYNVVHNDEASVTAATPPVVASGLLTVVCQTCRKNQDFMPPGAIHIDLHAVGQAETAQRQWDARHLTGKPFGGDALLEIPAPVAWRVECDDCMAHDDCSSCYAISTSECSTLGELLNWTAHLSDKDWLRVTTWMDMIRAVSLGSSMVGLIASHADRARAY